MQTTDVPLVLDLQFRGFVTGSTIRSKSNGEELCKYFGGIPFALPPVGAFRFLRPRPLPSCYRYGTRANPGVYTRKCGVCPQAKSSKLEDEDCLQLNIFIPSGPPPGEGWPVYFYIHGGYLQFGSANEVNPTALLAETSFTAIIVMPNYRLNVFGFLASHELLNDPSNRSGTVGNLGFWDQRLALHWTYTNVSYFGGNPSNVTVAGYSAGAHSVFYQLAYDLDHPPEERIIKRICMHANGPGVQPKTLSEHQAQFDELLRVLKIPSSSLAVEKLRLLRETTPAAFRKAVNKMRLHQFRAITDGHFIKADLFQELDDGTFSRKLLASNVHVLIGESANEHLMYARHRVPADQPEAIYQRLLADYPRWAVDVLRQTYLRDGALPADVKSWRELFGRIYADMQVHVAERGFIDALVRGGAGHLVHRYRIDWRSSITWAPKQFGATHWADSVIWFFGDGKSLPSEEKSVVVKAFIGDYAEFIKGNSLNWQKSSPLEVRRLRGDGTVDVWQDEWWEEKLKVWKALQQAYSQQQIDSRKSRL